MIRSFCDSGGVVQQAGFDNEAAEGLYVARALAERTDCDAETAADFAVLARTNAVADGIARHFADAGVPVCRLVEQERPADWRLAMAALEFLASLKSKAALRRYMEALNPGESAHGWFLTTDGPLTGDADKLEAELFSLAISTESILRIQTRFHELPVTATLSDLALDLALQPRSRQMEGEGVYVGTIHSAKGREWDTVWIVGFEDEEYCRNQKEIEENRRVAYVGMSRAKRQLVVTWARSRTPTYKRFPETHTPSRFIAEARL